MAPLSARWKVRHLLISWATYWTTLAVVTLAPAAIVFWNVSRPGNKVGVSAEMADGVVKLTVSVANSTAWSGSASLWAIGLALAGPPVVLWMLWLRGVSSRRAAGDVRDSEQLGRGDEMPLRHDDREKAESRVR